MWYAMSRGIGSLGLNTAIWWYVGLLARIRCLSDAIRMMTPVSRWDGGNRLAGQSQVLFVLPTLSADDIFRL